MILLRYVVNQRCVFCIKSTNTLGILYRLYDPINRITITTDFVLKFVWKFMRVRNIYELSAVEGLTSTECVLEHIRSVSETYDETWHDRRQYHIFNVAAVWLGHQKLTNDGKWAAPSIDHRFRLIYPFVELNLKNIYVLAYTHVNYSWLLKLLKYSSTRCIGMIILSLKNQNWKFKFIFHGIAICFFLRIEIIIPGTSVTRYHDLKNQMEGELNTVVKVDKLQKK